MDWWILAVIVVLFTQLAQLALCGVNRSIMPSGDLYDGYSLVLEDDLFLIHMYQHTCYIFIWLLHANNLSLVPVCFHCSSHFWNYFRYTMSGFAQA